MTLSTICRVSSMSSPVGTTRSVGYFQAQCQFLLAAALRRYHLVRTRLIFLRSSVHSHRIIGMHPGSAWVITVDRAVVDRSSW